MTLTVEEQDILADAAEADFELGHALFHLFGEQHIANLLAVAQVDRGEVAFFWDADEAVDFYEDVTDEGDSPELFKLQVIFGSWEKYDPQKETQS